MIAKSPDANSPIGKLMRAAAKPWWASKTIWVSVLTFVIGALSFVAGQDIIAGNPQIATWFAMALGLLNIVLRFLTGKPIEMGDRS